LALSALAAGCGPAAKSPADQAAFTERTRCGPEVAESALAPVLEQKTGLLVAPLYSTIEADKSGAQSQLRGALLTIGALPGVTAEWLDRQLECHSARAELGRIPASEDPFWLPGATVDIDVRPARDGFVIAVAGYSPSDARLILDRARAFAKANAAQR